MTVQRTVSPVDQSVYVERPLAEGPAIQQALETARAAQAQWRQVPLEERIATIGRFVEAITKHKAEIGAEITWQMGRPIAQTGGEFGGFAQRAHYMMQVAPEALADTRFTDQPGFTRFIRKVPVGVVFVIAPWNYPYLTAVNAVVPSILAGNAVILKHSAQTPLTAERFAEAFQEAGLPDGVFQFLHTSHADALGIVRSGAVNHVSFTGSVGGGYQVAKAAGETFISTTLELGGKDPGYVRPDANLQHAIENLGDGAFFNSGQCCCGIERLYVHEQVYDAFVDGLASFAAGYRLDNPTKADTNIGPMAKAHSADLVRDQIADAVRKGAKALVDTKTFPMDERGSPYIAPQVLTQVDHQMAVMRDESFGPVVGVMKVKSDEEAVRLMNDSPYGLTAAIWTSDVEAAERIGDQIETGTVFMNRCDYLDPALAWTGVKDTGRGVSLSKYAYDHLTRPKSFHLREKI